MLIGRYRAMLDACVLHPAFLRGALLWFADERLLQPKWSADILREWRESVSRRYPDVSEVALEQQIGVMTTAFPAAMISDYQPLIPVYDLPDADDRHVLAAAIMGKCSGIVTANLRDFPPAIVNALEIEVIHPDDFVVNIIDLAPGRALEACRRHRASMKRHPLDPEAFLERYRTAGLIQAHQRLMPHIGLI